MLVRKHINQQNPPIRAWKSGDMVEVRSAFIPQ
jgi:hypothetical protein